MLRGDVERPLERSRADDGLADQVDVGLRGTELVGQGGLTLDGIEQGQGVDTIPQVRAGRLAEVLLGGGQVEQVVGDLERHAEGGAEEAQRLRLVFGAPAEHGSEAG